MTPKKPHQLIKQKRKRAPSRKEIKNSKKKQRIQEMGKKCLETVQKRRRRHRVEEKIWENKALNKHKYCKKLVRGKETLSKR